MKRSFFFYCIVLFVVATFFGNKAHAVQDPTKNKAILVIMCYDSEGQTTGVGNTCTNGTGNCVPNFCTTIY